MEVRSLFCERNSSFRACDFISKTYQVSVDSKATKRTSLTKALGAILIHVLLPEGVGGADDP